MPPGVCRTIFTGCPWFFARNRVISSSVFGPTMPFVSKMPDGLCFITSVFLPVSLSRFIFTAIVLKLIPFAV